MSRENQEKTVYSVAELSALLGVSLPTAYGITRKEGFPAFRIGKRILIPKVSFEKWVESQTL